MIETATELEAYLAGQGDKRLLRVLTCGSVDDGKSTLIGRLLFDSELVFDDHMEALRRDSARFGTQGDEIDYALLMDGLVAEREQGITIDVAYRFFSTEQRKFIVADTPGHAQYTRNMATGASTADAAIVLVDARTGVVTQTRRHTYILSLLGVRHVVLSVNKMDLVEYSERRFQEIETSYRAFVEPLEFENVTAIPLSALRGENLVSRSGMTPWYRGVPLVEYLERIPLDEDRMVRKAFRMPVQWVNRPDSEFRGFAGTLAGGEVRPGDRVRIEPAGNTTRVARVVTYDGDLDSARAGQSVTLTLEEEIDVSRGDLLSAADSPPQVADQLQAHLVWMDSEPLLPGRPYLVKLGTRTVGATVTSIKYAVSVETMEHIAAHQLELNEIGVCNLALEQAIPFDPYAESRTTGGFIVINRISNATCGAGMVDFALRRADNIHPQPVAIDKEARSRVHGHRPCVVWFTGLSASGKSTVANLVESKLNARGRSTYLLDGDNVRHGLCKDLGFTDVDRVENIRRVAELARLMVDAGLVVLVAFISPFQSERALARSLVHDGEFVEVYVDAPLAVAEVRDPKGLYRKARRGELPHFTGIDSPYEPPENPELRIDTTVLSPEQAADQVLAAIELRVTARGPTR